VDPLKRLHISDDDQKIDQKKPESMLKAQMISIADQLRYQQPIQQLKV
jgi:hypothetical protein